MKDVPVELRLGPIRFQVLVNGGQEGVPTGPHRRMLAFLEDMAVEQHEPREGAERLRTGRGKRGAVERLARPDGPVSFMYEPVHQGPRGKVSGGHPPHLRRMGYI